MALALLSLLLFAPGALAADAVTGAVDTHLHVTMSQAAMPVFHGEPGSGEQATSHLSRFVNQVEAPQLKDAGVTLAYGSLWIPNALRPGRTALHESAWQVEQLRRFGLRRGDFAVVTTAQEARAQRALGRVALFIQLEGGEGIESVADVDALYALGVRCITLVHFVNTQLGGVARGQFFHNVTHVLPQGEEPLGLSALGKAVVLRMAQLGMVIDLAHASDATTRDTLALTEPLGVPVLVSHTGARPLRPFERNLSDALAQRVAKGGGLVGVTLYPGQLDVVEGQRPEGHARGTCDEVVAHWAHLARLLGPEAVVLGSDFNGLILRPAPGGRCPGGIANTSQLGALWPALEAAGVPHAALNGQAEQLLRFIEVVERKANKQAQAEAQALDTRALVGRGFFPGLREF